jgi:trimeric autotransporter adhesin
MVRRTLVNAAFIAAAIVPLGLISCSDDTNKGAGGTGGSGGTAGTAGTGGTGGTSGAPNDGGTSDAKSDAPTSDSGGGMDRADTAPTLPDGSVPPSGTQLAAGNVTVRGVTSDNYAVYSDDSTGTLNVIALAGGTPTAIGSADDRIAIKGAAVLSWVGSARVSQISVWTAAHGAKVLAMSSYANATAAAVSPDGERVLYFDAVDMARTRGSLFVAGTDGTGQKQLADSIALNDATCAPVLTFGGNAAAGAAFCMAPSISDGGTEEGGTSDGGSVDATADSATTDAGSDAGPTPAATVQTYSGANWTAATIATNVEPRVVIASTGTTVLVSAPAGLLAYPIAGGMPTTIDPAGGIGMFTNDGASVIYTTPANALKRATIVSPNPTTLAASGIAGLRAKSPDEKWLLGYSMIDTRQDLSDLYLASATTAGTPTTLTTALSAGLFGSDGFTADSSHAIYYTDITSTGVGNFFAAASSGGSPVALGTNVWLHYAGTAAKVVFNDNYDDAMSTADIRIADTAQAEPAKLLVSLADPNFFIAGSKDKVVYAWKYLNSSMAGLWVTPVP